MNTSRMRKLGTAVTCCMLVLPLTGCWDRIEINDLALITGASVDQVNAKTVELSVQIFVPRAAGGGGGGMSMGSQGGTGSTNTFVNSAKGENLADAFSHLQERMSRKLFWGHAEIFIFSEAAARHGIQDEVDYLMRAPQPRERAYIYVSHGKARQALELRSVLERDTSEALREIAKNKVSVSVTLADLSQMITSGSGAAVLPWISRQAPHTKGNPDTSVHFENGTAVFKGDKMVGVIDETTTRGVLWLQNEIKNAVITVEPKDEQGIVSVRLIKSRTKLKARIQNGKWQITARIHTENDAVENSTAANLTIEPKSITIVEKALEKDIKDRIDMALAQAQGKLKADIFNFAGVFHRAYPKEWHRMQSQWDELFPKVEVITKPEAVLLRPGLANVRASRPEKERSPKS
ncbi:Ger(x)C family spore germination protein [Paenibacillus sp. R14(2021)]|uniref:Ger(x)C family spore germination protein n=1 Tax=Paenibacillus sp. R14(2021) TaxID=2859228 RepID=UPI001C61597D|nr:Ger(x)C family spore germination protein [Paenibacillus sp. R14(2021)]